mmetsp:Transcript_23041/g.65309  ORF Transcript_23041/g.65309 Transcript_23041/m.65309 type:complete len:314 (+) Transcript_23041:1113-2054(+)
MERRKDGMIRPRRMRLHMACCSKMSSATIVIMSAAIPSSKSNPTSSPRFAPPPRAEHCYQLLLLQMLDRMVVVRLRPQRLAELRSMTIYRRRRLITKNKRGSSNYIVVSMLRLPGPAMMPINQRLFQRTPTAVMAKRGLDRETLRVAPLVHRHEESLPTTGKMTRSHRVLLSRKSPSQRKTPPPIDAVLLLNQRSSERWISIGTKTLSFSLNSSVRMATPTSLTPPGSSGFGWTRSGASTRNTCIGPKAESARSSPRVQTANRSTAQRSAGTGSTSSTASDSNGRSEPAKSRGRCDTRSSSSTMRSTGTLIPP